MPNLQNASMSPGIMNADARSTHAMDRRALPPALDSVFPLLLALADDELAAAAIRVTSVLARSRGAVPTVIKALGVDREAEDVIAPFVGTIVEASLTPEYRSECRYSLQKRVSAAVGNVQWRFEVDGRSPAEGIAELARQLQPGLIVMGLRHHSLLRRVVSRELLRAVVRATRTPVLAVRPELSALPRRVVVAVDFGEASIRAARMARHLLADDGELHIVHVAPDRSEASSVRVSPFRGRARNWVREELDRLIEDLSPSPGMTMTPVALEGDVVLSIEGCAERVGAELVAVGSDHHSPLERLLSGSVSMAIAHTAHWSMLVAPSSRAE